MANVLVQESSLEAIADAIRAKNGTQNTYKPAKMAEAIAAISGGGITPTGTKQISITANGTTTEDVTNYASAEISVNVSGGGGGGSVTVQEGTFALESDVSITANGVSIPVGFTGEPDTIFIWMDDATFQNLTSVSNNRIYKAMLVKRSSADSTFPPTRMSNTLSAQSALSSDATHIYAAAITATTCSASANGAGIGTLSYATANTDKNKINSDGSITIARTSTSSQIMFAGTYHYIAVNGVNFGYLC